MSSRDLRRIGGVLSQFWVGGRGPTRPQIAAALLVAGYNGSTNEGNKQQLILNSIVHANDATARSIVEELVGLLREDGGAVGLASGPALRTLALSLQQQLRVQS
jgi:hypothetical protein